MKKPNIIFYFSDQQRADTINDKVTPNLCKLAEEGVNFLNNYTCQPVCGPARACLQTGVYATENGCHVNGIALPTDKKVLAELLTESGYQTAYVGKWHLASDNLKIGGFTCERKQIPRERLGGYQYFRGSDVLEFTSHGYDGYIFDENGNKLDFKGYRADCINDYALEYIDNCDKKQPFFLFISQLEPHHQNDHHHFEGYKETISDYTNYPIPEDLSFLKGNYKEEYPDYLSAINRLDYNVGKLVDTLKKNEIYDNTIIIYTSDHGCHFKTRNMEYKRSCHNSATKTPLIIKGGKFCGGIKEKRLSSLIDLPTTILDLAKIKSPEHFRGISLAKYMLCSDIVRKNVFIQISESQVGRAIITDKYTYSVRSFAINVLKKSSKLYQEDYLYDNKLDKIQKYNLVKDNAYRKIRTELKKQLLEAMAFANEKKPKIIPNIIRRKS